MARKADTWTSAFYMVSSNTREKKNKKIWQKKNHFFRHSSAKKSRVLSRSPCALVWQRFFDARFAASM